MTASQRFSIRAPLVTGLAAVVALVLVFGLWGTMTRISGAIIAQGHVEVERDRQIVQHPEGGVIADILVTEGAAVQAGDALLRLDGAALRSEMAIVDGQLSELAARSARLISERDGLPDMEVPPPFASSAATSPGVAAQLEGERRLFAARRATLSEERKLLEQRIAQITAQSAGLAAQAAALSVQLDLIEAERAAQQGLFEKGLAQAGTVRALDREHARLTGSLGEVTAELARAGDQRTEIEIAIASLATRRQEAAAAELRQIEPVILELSERRRALGERIDRLEIRAPVSGVVLGLQVTTPRAVLRPGEPALYVVPQDRPLVISARIAPIHIDEVSLGQSAELVFPGFAARDTPHLTGRVTRIAADAVADPQTGATFYATEIELAEGERSRLGPRKLLPGMPVEVFLQTGRHAPLAYLMKPFSDYLSRAFRES